MDQRSEAWFRMRAGRITGSRFAQAMADKNSSTYHSFVDRLVEERRTGRCLDRDFVNPAMQWGIDHEESARRWYCRSQKRQVDRVAFVVHPEFDFVGVSPDGLIDDDGLLEIKCPQLAAFENVLKSRRMPARYRWQVQGQMWVCDRQWLDFVCYYPRGRGVVIRVQRDDTDLLSLEARCIEIDRMVERRLESRRPSSRLRDDPVAKQDVPKVPVSTRELLDHLLKSRDQQPAPASSELPAWIWLVGVLTMLIVFLVR